MERDKWRPETKETADHSLPYITAVALMDGEVTLRQFDPEHLHNPALLDLIQKIECREKKEYTDIYRISFPNKVTLAMNDGRTMSTEIKDPKGHPLNPLGRSQIELKFRQGADGLLDRSQQDRFISLVWDLEGLRDIKQLMDCLVVL
jgi:2-methylcitrate dehydratase